MMNSRKDPYWSLAEEVECRRVHRKDSLNEGEGFLRWGRGSTKRLIDIRAKRGRCRWKEFRKSWWCPRKRQAYERSMALPMATTLVWISKELLKEIQFKMSLLFLIGNCSPDGINPSVHFLFDSWSSFPTPLFFLNTLFLFFLHPFSCFFSLSSFRC